MKLNKIAASFLALGLVITADTSFGAFGNTRASSSGVGVSRSYSRPSAPAPSSYSRPAATPSSSSYSRPASVPSSSSYSAPRSSYSQPSSSYNQPSSSYNRGYNNNSNGYNQNQGFNTNYNNPQRNSTMRDIGVTAAGVGGGILAASAIQHLISSPNHPGMYTNPQYPGQYFNGQGAQVAPQQYEQSYVPQGQEQAQDQRYIQPQGQAPQVAFQQRPVEKGGFFSFLWAALGFVIHLAFYLAVVGALAFGGWKAFQYFKPRYKEVVANKGMNPNEAKMDLDNKAQDIFANFQANSDSAEWVRKNTKYLPVNEVLSPKSEVLKFEHRTIDVKIEQGKLRGSVRFTADLKNEQGEEHIDQYWNFEKEGEDWKVIGVEPVL